MPSNLDDIYETRRENLTRLLREPGAKTQLAARLGASQAHITHLLKPPTAASARAIREETARQIEEIMGLARGHLDKPDVVIERDGRTTVVEAKRYGPPAAGRHPRAGESTVLYDIARPRKPTDAEILEESFKVVHAAVVARGGTIPPEKAATMARLVYEQSVATGKVDPALVTTLMNLMS